MNLIVKWMQESYFDICHFWWKSPLSFVCFGLFFIFMHFSYSTSIHDSLTIELSLEMNQQNFWIWWYFKLNWVKQYWTFSSSEICISLPSSLMQREMWARQMVQIGRKLKDPKIDLKSTNGLNGQEICHHFLIIFILVLISSSK